MADNHINFKLGSSFDGEGFNAAQKAIDANKKEINSARAGLGDLAKAFEGVHPAIGQAAGTVKGFTQAFVSGGIVGGVIQLAITGISKAIEICGDIFEKAQERAKKFAELSSEYVTEFATSANDRFKRLGEQLAELKKSADAFSNAMKQAVDSDTNEKVYQIAVNKLQRITDDMTEREKAIIEAQAALETDIVKNSAAHQKATAALEAAITARNDSEAKVNEANIANTKAQAALKQAANDTEISEEAYKNIRDAATLAAKNLRDAEINLKNAETAAAKAAEDEVEATRKLNLAKLEGERKVRDAEAKRQQEIDEIAKKEREAAEKKAEAEEKAAEKIRKDQDDWDNFMIQQREKLENALGAPKSVSEILDEFDKVLKDGAEEILSSETQADNVEKSGGEKKTKNKSSSSAEASVNIPDPMNVNLQNPQAIINAQKPVLQPFKDAQADAREKQREQRDLMSQLNGKFGAEIGQFFRLLGTPESARNAQEQGLVDYYKSQAIPEMVSQLGVEMTAKLLGDNAKHVLMKEDFREYFGTFNRMVNTLKKLGLK